MTMIERAAKAIYPHPNVDWDDARTISKLALLAALDAEDKATLEAVGLAMARVEWEAGEPEPQIHSLDYLGAEDRDYWLASANAAISALRSLVQGASQ